MERLRQKRPRLVLTSDEYDRLRILVLERDGWKCQSCGSRTIYRYIILFIAAIWERTRWIIY